MKPIAKKPPTKSKSKDTGPSKLKKKSDTKEERSRNVEEKKKVKKEEKSKNQEEKAKVKKEEVSKNQEKEKKTKKTKEVKSKESKDSKGSKDSKDSKDSKTKDTKTVSVDDERKLILQNKKKFCKKFFSEALNGKKLMQDFVAHRFERTSAAEAMKKHEDKCRYNDILCPDQTRVVLKDRPPENDFIHANWMTMPDKFVYISAQGPMDETLEDFWHMVYTEKCPAIVMICDFIEDNLQKCSQYIPRDHERHCDIGPFRICRQDTINVFCENVTNQVLEISMPESPDAPIHLLTHFHYRNWRDHSAPLSSGSVLKILKALKDPQLKGPPVIHCSAGIGRTATFIGVDYGNQRIGQVGEKMNVFDLVQEMRMMRDKAVQSHFQFMFMLICIGDLMVSEGVPYTEIMKDLLACYQNFHEYMKNKKAAKEKKEKEDKEAEEKKKKEEEEKKPKEKELEVEKTQSSTTSTTQDSV